MRIKHVLAFAAFSGFAAVLSGAFGAHLLKNFTDYQQHILETSVRYQMYHALALLAVAALFPADKDRRVTWVFICWMTGTVFFSGSLYALAFTQDKRWGMVTPFGGLFLMAGWLLVLYASLNLREEGKSSSV